MATGWEKFTRASFLLLLLVAVAALGLAIHSVSRADDAFAKAIAADKRAQNAMNTITGPPGAPGDKGLTGDKGPIGDKGPTGETGAGTLSIQCLNYSTTMLATEDRVQKTVSGSLSFGNMNWTERAGAVREYYISGKYYNNGSGIHVYDLGLIYKNASASVQKFAFDVHPTTTGPKPFTIHITQHNTSTNLNFSFMLIRDGTTFSRQDFKPNQIGKYADHELTLSCFSSSGGGGSIVTCESFRIVNIYNPQL